nr:hypothetical protein [Tanacetum cinerariifolium]
MTKPHSELSPRPHQWFWRKGIHMVRVSGGDEHVVALDFNGYLSALLYRRMDSEEFCGRERMVPTSAATVLVVERDGVSQGCERRKKKNEKIKELKAQINFEGCFGTSRYSESKPMSTKEHGKRKRSRRSRSPRTSVFSKIRRERSRSPIRRERSRSPRQRAKEGRVFKWLESRGKSVFARSDIYEQHSHSRYTEALSESEDSGCGHWKSRSKKKKSSREEDDSQPWVCEEKKSLHTSDPLLRFPKNKNAQPH